MRPNGYYGISVHPLELIFFKTNRGIEAMTVERYSKWIINAAQRVYSYRPNPAAQLYAKPTGWKMPRHPTQKRTPPTPTPS
jgi:hypothetical protein